MKRYSDYKDIFLFKEVMLLSSFGKVKATAWIEPSGYIPDIHVEFSPVIGELYDDSIFMQSVGDEIAKLGYKEPGGFSRAEMGMQSTNVVAIEPHPDFNKFVINKFGWIDLSQRRRKAK